MEPIQILDIIHHKNQYYTQEFFVLDRKPSFLFEKTGPWLIGEDSGFFRFYYYNHDPFSKGFAGREFYIPLKTGEIVKADGQYWDGIPEDYSGLIEGIGCGVAEDLATCNVFCNYYIDKVIVEEAREKVNISNNYDKYDKRHVNFGKNTIISKFK